MRAAGVLSHQSFRRFRRLVILKPSLDQSCRRSHLLALRKSGQTPERVSFVNLQKTLVLTPVEYCRVQPKSASSSLKLQVPMRYSIV